MRRRRLSELASIAHGQLVGDDVEVSEISTDSRTLAGGELFVAIRGERDDGHRHAAEALERGARAVVVDASSRLDVEGPRIVVDDTVGALLAIAADELRALAPRVVAITGANGKTSAKDMTGAVLAGRLQVHASPRSFNTEVGVPLTVLGTRPGTEVLVLEMGARHVGDVALLCEHLPPDVAVVTNVGVAHMEVFGSWERIVAASSEPIEALAHGSTAILAADDPVVRGFGGRTRARVVLFGLSPDAGVRAVDVQLDERGCPAFLLEHEGIREPVHLSVPGEHMVQNALAASAVGLALGLSPAECAAGLKDARVSAWRMETFTTETGLTVVNDAYNANPESMAAGLRTARWIARDGRLIAVLGHMAELGPIAREEHERLGDLVTRLRVDRLIAVGERARPIAMAAVREGLDPADVSTVANADEAVELLDTWCRAGDVVFLKGSRVAGLERVAEAMS
jgi:UDP-N-acetylmuramoyl-tripeptide--D-alanyl-D-alanine ligase